MAMKKVLENLIPDNKWIFQDINLQVTGSLSIEYD